MGKRRTGAWRWSATLVAILIICCLCMTACGNKDDAKATTAASSTRAATENTSESSTEAKSDEVLATVFFASDYQQQEGFPAPADTLRGILGAVRGAGENEPELFAFLGDYTNDRKLHDYQLSPEDPIKEIRGVVGEAFPADGQAASSGDSDRDAVRTLFVQGNHDRMSDSIADSGLHEYDDYLIYVLNTEGDFPWKQGKASGCLAKVRKSSEEMKKCFDELISKGEKRPVFIAGHVPLHFTARTSSRHTTGDNLYSSLIFDVVNEAGRSLDIVYLFGHNHSKGWDCYMGGSSVYKGVGDVLLIPEFDEKKANTDSFTGETLAFTYMNAGYTGYYMNCGPEELEAGKLDQYRAADETLTGSLCQIWPDRLVITRYAGDGPHALGGDGAADPYKGGIDAGLIGEEHYAHRVDGPAVVERKAVTVGR